MTEITGAWEYANTTAIKLYVRKIIFFITAFVFNYFLEIYYKGKC